MLFKNNIMLRLEGDSYFIYNNKNGGLLRVRKEEIELLRANESLADLLGILSRMDMINRTIDDNVKSQPIEENQRIRGNFFNLKSNINPFNIVWAITSKCNLKCLYCFPEVESKMLYSKDLSNEQLLYIAKQIIDAKVFKVTLTGGEASLNDNVWNIIDYLHGNGISVAMISNGTALNSDIVEKIRLCNVPVAISLDGHNEDINSITRGKGTFSKIINSINILKKVKIPVSILITVTRHNFDSLDKLLELINSLKIKYVTMQDLRPFGKKNNYDAMRLTIEQEISLSKTIDRIEDKYPHLVINTTELFIFGRAGRKKIKSGKIMQCPAGDNCAYIDFYGDMYPCTSLPTFKMGNLLEKNLTELWRGSEKILELRDIKKKSIDSLVECSDCSNKITCDGGCRGDALYYSSDLMGSPSRCPKSNGLKEMLK